MPQVMPRECAKVIDEIPMPGRWVGGIDATPGREMTLGSRQWWEDHGPWLDANKTKLKLSAANWKKREEALKKDESVPEDEGNDDWDSVCRFKPSGEGDDDDEEDEWDDEEDEDGEDEEDKEDEQEGEAQRDKPSKKDKAAKEPHMKLASLHPDWPWVTTVLGLEREQWWTQETLKRDQDDFNMHIYNDFSNYGMVEVMENIVSWLPRPPVDAIWLIPPCSSSNSATCASPRPATVKSGPKSRALPYSFAVG
jgi:hypothetical protein